MIDTTMAVSGDGGTPMVEEMKINRKIAARIDPRVRQLADQMMGYMADHQALLNSGTDVGLDAIFRLVQASFSGLWAL